MLTLEASVITLIANETFNKLKSNGSPWELKWLIQNKCKNEYEFLSAKTEAYVLSSVAANWAVWMPCTNVVLHTGVGELNSAGCS